MKIGLIGCGYLGKIHAKCIKEILNVELIGVYDIFQEAAIETAEKFNTTAYSDLQNLMENCDAVDIIASTTAHSDLAKQAMRAGKHCFIEKPLTATVAEAEKLIALAKQQNVIVQVGHVERYNPAFLAALPHISQPIHIEAHRLCPFNLRGTDVSVVHDLMIHDIDLILSIVQSEVVEIQSTGYNYLTERLDVVHAKLTFANRAIADITASRVATQPVRKMYIYQPKSCLTVDFHEKTAEKIAFENSTPSFTKIPVIEHNAIVEELSDFVHTVQHKKIPRVTMENGLNALRIADKVVTKILQQNCA
jgi:predicted dehydrogenase